MALVSDWFGKRLRGASSLPGGVDVTLTANSASNNNSLIGVYHQPRAAGDGATVIDITGGTSLAALVIENRTYVPLDDAAAALEKSHADARAMHARHVAAAEALVASFSAAEKLTKTKFENLFVRLQSDAARDRQTSEDEIRSLSVAVSLLNAELFNATALHASELQRLSEQAATAASVHSDEMLVMTSKFEDELHSQANAARVELQSLSARLANESALLSEALDSADALRGRIAQRESDLSAARERLSVAESRIAELESASQLSEGALMTALAELRDASARAQEAESRLKALNEELASQFGIPPPIDTPLSAEFVDTAMIAVPAAQAEKTQPSAATPAVIRMSADTNEFDELRMASALAISALLSHGAAASAATRSTTANVDADGTDVDARAAIARVPAPSSTAADSGSALSVVERTLKELASLRSRVDIAEKRSQQLQAELDAASSSRSGSVGSNNSKSRAQLQRLDRSESMIAVDGKVDDDDGAFGVEGEGSASSMLPLDDHAIASTVAVSHTRRSRARRQVSAREEAKIDWSDDEDEVLDDNTEDREEGDDGPVDGDAPTPNSTAVVTDSTKSTLGGEPSLALAVSAPPAPSRGTPTAPDAASSSSIGKSLAAPAGITPIKLQTGTRANAPTGAAAGGADAQSKLRAAEHTIKELRNNIRRLEAAEAKASAAGAMGGKAPGVDDKAIADAVEKNRAQLEKKWKKEHDELAKDAKKEADAASRKLARATADLDEAQRQLEALTTERDALKKKTAGAKDLEIEVEALRIVAEQGKKDAAALVQANSMVEEVDRLYREEQLLRKKYWNMLEDMKGKIRVYCRTRPVSMSEASRGGASAVSFPDDMTIELEVGKGRDVKSFVFDNCFGPSSTQDEIFTDTENLVQSAFDGYNVAIFAYGQTGSGKTHTMVGTKELPGITPRALRRLFQIIEKNAGVYDVRVEACMVEVYLDQLRDLFWRIANPRGRPEDAPKLDIKKDDKGLVNVRGAIITECPTEAAAMELFDAGNAARHVGSTNMNSASSRSHLVYSLLITAVNKQTQKTATGKLSLIDLAGSERVAKTGASADRLKEAQSINKSLSALGNVISALSTNEKFIPYRDNKLTQLMSDSLGGNAKTLCFVCISPVDINLDETQSSLTYAARMKLITNSAEKMQETAQVAKLKSIIAQLRAGNNPAFVDIEEEGDVETDGQSSPASSTAAEDQDDADASATPSSVVTGGDATPSSESVVAGDGDNESSAP